MKNVNPDNHFLWLYSPFVLDLNKSTEDRLSHDMAHLHVNAYDPDTECKLLVVTVSSITKI